MLPKKYFCWSLRNGTVGQGITSLVTACINILCVALGLGDLIEARIYKFCWPSETCYDELKAFEMTLVIANIVINALLFVFSPLLLNGIKNNKPSHLFPFKFMQGLMISGLIAAAVTGLVVCIGAGTWMEYVPLLICSGLYVSLQTYSALVIHAYYTEMRRERVATSSEPICGREIVPAGKTKEFTIEDFVF